MRLITWNCREAFARKAPALFALNPDIAVVPECSRRDAEAITHVGYSALWFGDAARRKGIAVFHKPEWTITTLAEPRYKWVVPLRVEGPRAFTLLAVWAWIDKGGIPAYVRLVRESIQANPDWFSNGPVVMLGDFNSNSRGNTKTVGTHANLVADLTKYGLTSAYHHVRAEEHGCESTPTFHHQRRKGYHIDYVFLPQEWMQTVSNLSVGSQDDWSHLSDHYPLSIDVG